MTDLTLAQLQETVKQDAAIRLILPLQPPIPGTKVFPPTHEGGQYAWETRRLKVGEQYRDSRCVLLDSVQSQANRMELALLRAIREQRLQLPLIEVDFSGEFPKIGTVTSLEAPHRMADAILRDSDYQGVSFRESEPGRAFIDSTVRNANGLYHYCPTALIYGMWDSTALAKGAGLGNKFQRCVVSEMVGIGAEAGLLSKSRRDPLLINNAAKVYSAQDGRDWTAFDDERADRDNQGKSQLFKRPGSDTKKDVGKPSAINHSSVTPSFVVAEEDYTCAKRGEPVRGGVTLERAELTFVLSLPGLRRLRFPRPDGQPDPQRDQAARTVLAALALCGIALQIEEGFDLRSRCLLVPEGGARYQRLGATGTTTDFTLDGDGAIGLFQQAVAAAREQELDWLAEPLILQPQQRLVELIRLSHQSDAPEAE